MLVLTVDICPDDSLRRGPSRLAARLITGPVAFLVAGVADVLIYALRSRHRPRTISARPPRGL
jgi:hypothetical protein